MKGKEEGNEKLETNLIENESTTYRVLAVYLEALISGGNLQFAKEIERIFKALQINAGFKY